MNMGAGYGNKDETRLSVLAAILAWRAGRPVKIEATREEEFVAGRHRHATITTVNMGVKNDGTVTAVHATTIMDTGALSFFRARRRPTGGTRSAVPV